jgi:hypothetical protein
MTAPRHCPACSTELYPIARLRPRAGLSPVAKLILSIGVAASSAIFIGGMIWGIVQRETYEGRIGQVRPSGKLMGMITLVPALVPGLIMGWIAYRLPKSLKLRCPRCTWRERFQMGRDGQVIARVGMPVSATDAERRRRLEENRVFDKIDDAPPPPLPRRPGNSTYAATTRRGTRSARGFIPRLRVDGRPRMWRLSLLGAAGIQRWRRVWRNRGGGARGICGGRRAAIGSGGRRTEQ